MRPQEETLTEPVTVFISGLADLTHDWKDEGDRNQ